MSKLEFDFESYNKIKDGYELTKEDAYQLATNFQYTSNRLFETAAQLRNKHKGNVVSFSKKAFFNIVIFVEIHVITVHTKQNQMIQNYL